MIKYTIFLCLLFPFLVQASEVITPEKEQNYINEGKKQLEHLMQQNAINDANGQSDKNVYIFYLVEDNIDAWTSKEGAVYEFGGTQASPKTMLSKDETYKINEKLKLHNSVQGVTPIYLGLHKEAVKLMVRDLLKTDGVANTADFGPDYKTEIAIFLKKYSDIYIKIGESVRNVTPSYSIISMLSFHEIRNIESTIADKPIVEKASREWFLTNYEVYGAVFNDSTKAQIRGIVFNNFSQSIDNGIANKANDFVSRVSTGVTEYKYFKIANNCTFGTINELATASEIAKNNLKDKIKKEIIEMVNNSKDYLTIDYPNAFNNHFHEQILPDRLDLLVQHGKTNYKLYVVLKRVPFALKHDDAVLFAEEIGKSVEKFGNNSSNILMVVPYYVSNCLNNNGLFGTIAAEVRGITMPAVYCKDATLAKKMNDAIKLKAGTTTINWEQLFGEAFKLIPKSYTLHKVVFGLKFNKWTNDTIITTSNYTVGYDRIYDFKIFADSRIKAFEEAIQEYEDERDVAGYDIGSYKTFLALDNKIRTIASNTYTYIPVEHGLKEKYLFENGDPSQSIKDFIESYVFYNTSEQTNRFLGRIIPTNSGPTDEAFVINVNSVRRQKKLETLDKTGIALSLVGLDFITDGLGLIDAVYYKDGINAAIYSVALAIPASAVLMQGFREGKMFAKSIENGKEVWRVGDDIIDVSKLVSAVKSIDLNAFITKHFRNGTIESGGKVIAATKQLDNGKTAIKVEAGQTIEKLTDDFEVIDMVDDADIILTDAGNEFLETSGELILAQSKSSGRKCIVGAPLCFDKGTLVKTEQGDLPIEQITEGVSVWSYDEKTHTKVLNKVAKVFRNATTKMMRLVVGKDTILTTPEHPFYALDPSAEIGGRWTKAHDLKQNFKVLLLSGMMAMVNMVQPIDTIATVYNFEVEKTHNYYVGTEGVLVHNSCNLSELRTTLANNPLWDAFAANLKTLDNTITRAERQAFYGKLNEVFKGDKPNLTKFLENFNAGDDAFKTLLIKEPDLVRKTLSSSGVQFLNFLNKTLAQKLDDIAAAWASKYPQIFIDRSMFEHIMGRYRYLKSAGWGHTADIASNFKAVDFYGNFTTSGNRIFAETAVSMKTTTTKDVGQWMNTQAVKDNIQNLIDNMGSNAGIVGNNQRLFYNKAEVHIYMKKEDVNAALRINWISKLNTTYPQIKFEINALEDFVK